MKRKFKLKEPKPYLKKSKSLDDLKKLAGLFTYDQIKELEVNLFKMRKASKRVNANHIVADYYKSYSEELLSDTILRTSDRVRNCFTHAFVDYYRLQQVKVINSVNLCHDKFCVNCQNQISMHRYAKYKPVLDELQSSYDIYHVVFTIPNCKDIELKDTLDKMYKKFAYLIRYFQGTKKVKGIDFSQYGYAGAIKSPEIGVKEKGFLSEMHPHFHCIFLLKKGFSNPGSHVNTYSYKKSEIQKDTRNKKEKIFFSDFEILLQKIWYLLYNDIKVTKQSIDNLELGYSCYARKIYKDYKEIFKYAMKGLYDPKTSSFQFLYQTFKYLKEAIKDKKFIQGYGILNVKSFLSDKEIEEQDNKFNNFIAGLLKLEDPMKVVTTILELLKEADKETSIKFVSKNSLKAKVDIIAGDKDKVL